MKLLELLDQGYKLRGWAMRTIRGEHRLIVKLERHDRVFVAHSPFVETVVSDVEFTEPVPVAVA